MATQDELYRDSALAGDIDVDKAPMTSEGNSRFALWGKDTRKTRGEHSRWTGSSPMLACKALAGLLLYPDDALIEAVPEITAILREAGLPPGELEAVLAFCDRLARAELLDAQSEYVALFDGVPSLSLYLFGHAPAIPANAGRRWSTS